MEVKDIDKATICECIIALYKEAVAEDCPGKMWLLEHIYIKAKKMNRKLVEYKNGGVLPPPPIHNSYKEEDWWKELKDTADNVRKEIRENKVE